MHQCGRIVANSICLCFPSLLTCWCLSLQLNGFALSFSLQRQPHTVFGSHIFCYHYFYNIFFFSAVGAKSENRSTVSVPVLLYLTCNCSLKPTCNNIFTNICEQNPSKSVQLQVSIQLHHNCMNRVSTKSCFVLETVSCNTSGN